MIISSIIFVYLMCMRVMWLGYVQLSV
jgi:hypothetical protein